MTSDQRSEVTTLLEAIRAGQADAQAQLVRLVYDELRQLAAGLMRREGAGHTLQPTALVHEALLRLLGSDGLSEARDRAHLFAAAARAMRHILVDHARRHAAAKRGGGRESVPLDEGVAYVTTPSMDLLALHDALDQLAALNERQARVVELRFFGGFTVEEIADQLQLSVATVEGDFRKARAFLHSRLVGDA
jgi:RNA polymerase sigma factor (TIGR02999 family)